MLYFLHPITFLREIYNLCLGGVALIASGIISDSKQEIERFSYSILQIFIQLSTKERNHKEK